MENVLNILFCLSLLYIATTNRVMGYLNAFIAQGVLLFLILILPLLKTITVFTFILPVTILAVKSFLIPSFIKKKIIIELEVKRTIESNIQQFNFLLLNVFSIIIAFLASSAISASTNIEPIPVAAAFSAILTGLYIIIFRKKLIVHVLGFLILENGIFLLGTSIAGEMPVLIEIAILLDVFVAVFLMGIAINKLSS